MGHGQPTPRVMPTVAAAALRPGAVLGQLNDGLTNFVSDIEDIRRGEVAGYNSRVTGGFRQLFPRLSKDDYAALLVANLPEEEGGLEDLLGQMNHLTKEERDGFTAARKMVRQPLPDGTFRFIIVPRVPEAQTELEILDGESTDDHWGDPAGVDTYEVELKDRAKRRKYTLAQMLTDEDVIKKYNLPKRAVETAKRVAATDPGFAARIYQDLMNAIQQDVAVRVVAGEYSRDRTQATNAIRQMCAGIQRQDTAVHSQVNMNMFYMFGPKGEGDWFVSGPLRYATEVSYVYWLVSVEGVTMPSVLLAMELVLLSIDICDGFSCAEPQLTYHVSAGPECGEPGPDSGISARTASELSVSGRLTIQGFKGRLAPVLGRDGRQIATAVRVTQKYSLINSHVVQSDSMCSLDDNPVSVRSQLSRDLWSARTPVGEGVVEPWRLREPVVGETVIICYLNDDVVSTSEPLRVVSVDASCVVTTKDSSVTYGMSGGALVALNDFSLLGIHSASTQTSLLSYKFGNQQFSELLELDSASTFSRYADAQSFAETVANHFQRRGLWGILTSVIDSLEPISSEGMLVGMLASSGDYAYTTCDPSRLLEIGLSDKRVQKFETVTPGLYRCKSFLKGPAYTRSPEFFEKIFVVGFDGEAYISEETYVSHIGPDSKSFVISDFPGDKTKPLQGCWVMAWDGAVLGLCGTRSYTTASGIGYNCFTLPKDAPAVKNKPRDVLAASFPFLNLSAWPDELFEEVFTHSSVGRYSDGRVFNSGCKPLANIGDNVAKAQLYKSLRETTIPHSQWAVYMQSLQSNSSFAKVAWDFNYAALLIVGSGVNMQKDSKAYADVTEALIGAASLIETAEVITKLCQAMGIVQMTRPKHQGRSMSEIF